MPTPAIDRFVQLGNVSELAAQAASATTSLGHFAPPKTASRNLPQSLARYETRRRYSIVPAHILPPRLKRQWRSNPERPWHCPVEPCASPPGAACLAQCGLRIAAFTRRKVSVGVFFHRAKGHTSAPLSTTSRRFRRQRRHHHRSAGEGRHHFVLAMTSPVRVR